MVSWVTLSWRLASSLASLVNTILQNCRVVNPVSNFLYLTRLPQAQQRRLLCSAPLGPSCCTRMCCLDFSLGVFVRCLQLPLSVQSAPQISYNLRRQHSFPPLAPVSHCPPFLSFSLLSSLSRFLPQRSASFVSVF